MRDAGAARRVACDVEFAVRRDVRNATIVREVDRERQFRLLRAAAVGVFFVALFTFNVHQHDASRRLGTQREAVAAARKEEERIQRHLKLEVDTHSALDVLQRRAAALHMVAPGPDTSVVIERVTSSPSPARSIVASR